MKLTQILITTLLMVSAVEVFATTEHQQTAPAAPVTIPTEDQSAEATTVKSATSEVAVEEEIKEKATAQ